MPGIQQLHSMTPARSPRRLALGVLLTAVIALIGSTSTVTSVTAEVPVAGNAYAVAAQATSPVGQNQNQNQNPGPRLQPVGNGNTIASPVDTTDDSSSRDRSWWWRVVFGAAVVVVVLVALIQHRQVPDRARGIGGRRGTGRRNSDRNALGH